MPQIKIYQDDTIPSPMSRLWQIFSSNPLSLAGLWAVGFLLIIALFGPLMAPYPPDLASSHAILLPPSWEKLGTVEHFLGTDELGRDLFSRLLTGTQLTFGLSILVVSISLLIGSLIGALSGMMRGIKSSILSHFLDGLLSIPSLLLAVLIVAIMGPGLSHVCLAVTLALIPQFVRTIHQSVHDELQKDYVTAAKLDGANQLQIFWFVIMPNVWETVIIQTTLAISSAILDIAALGFLGLGAQDPSPEWGTMVSLGVDNLLSYPWTVTIPGIAILFTVLSINLVGDGLKSALTPIRN